MPKASEREALALESVKLAVELGVEVNSANANGDTALHGAARPRTRVGRSVSRESGADVEANNKAGRTPLETSAPRRTRR